MRVVAGRPDPIAQTPMMNAFIRYDALNPYWNSPPDITARKLAPNVLKDGRAYLKKKGYEVLSNWSDHARVIDPMSVDWQAVVAGREQVMLRQKPGPGQFDGQDEVHVPQPAGHLASRHAGEGKDRGRRAAGEQRLRPARGCAALRPLAVQRPPARDARRKAGAEGQPAGAGAALHHLSDGGAERDLDRLFRRFLRQGPAPARQFASR